MYNNIPSNYTVVHFLTLCYALVHLNCFKVVLHIEIVVHKKRMMITEGVCVMCLNGQVSCTSVHLVVTWLCVICLLTLSKFMLVCY
jgi:hypothetical protein